MTQKFLLALLLVVSFTISAKDREEPFTATDAVKEMPGDIASIVDAETLNEMIAYYEAGIKGKCTSVLGDSVDIISLEPARIVYPLSKSVTAEIFVLNPKSEYPIIGYIETINVPQPDSNVKFYTHNWRPADNIVAIDPQFTDWLTKDGSKHIDDVIRVVPFVLASYSYNPDTKILTLTNEMKGYYHKDDVPDELAYLKPCLKYKWTGTKFKPVK